ncbi:MAG: hypothetical protein ACOYOU_03365 [Kiritimatiellia bacterium]
MKTLAALFPSILILLMPTLTAQAQSFIPTGTHTQNLDSIVKPAQLTMVQGSSRDEVFYFKRGVGTNATAVDLTAATSAVLTYSPDSREWVQDVAAAFTSKSQGVVTVSFKPGTTGTNGDFLYDLSVYDATNAMVQIHGTLSLMPSSAAGTNVFPNTGPFVAWTRIVPNPWVTNALVGGTNYAAINGTITLPAIAGPAGPMGPAGTNGSDGATGPQGPAGPANYGVDATNSYRGDWGAAASNLAAGKATLADVAGVGYLTNGGYIVEQSYSIVSNSVDTGILIVSDYSNGNATAFGTYVGTTTNANGWYYKFSFGLKSLRNTNDAGYYQLTGLPPTWSTPPLISDEGTGGSATGRVYVDYLRLSTTNLLADASGIYGDGAGITNVTDAVARANNVLTSNAIPTTAAQVGAVATNDTRYLASLTNAAAFDVAGAAAGVQNSLSVHSTNGMAHLTLFGETITNVSINGVDGTRSNRSVHLTYSEPPDTNFLEKIGGTVSGPIYTTSSTALAGGNPQQSELTTAGWIRQLISASGQAFYATTNLMPAAWSPTNFGFSPDTQAVAFSRVYVAPTNSQYIGWVTTTNLQSYLGGNTITINAYLSRQGGGGGPTVTLHPEIYFSYSTNTALANLTGDFIAEPRAIATGTNLYQWVVPIPPQTFTAAVYILRTFKIDAITGSTRPNVAFVGGGSTPSHILVAGLSAGQGYVYEAPVDGGIYGRKNQSWVGAVGTNDTRYLAGLTNESRYWQNAAIIPLATNRYSVTLGGSAVQVGNVYWLLTNSASWRAATGTLTIATTDGSYLEDVLSSNNIAFNTTVTPGTTIGGFAGGGSRLNNTQILFTAWCQDGGVGPYYAAMSNIVPRTFDRSMTPWQYTNDTPSIVSRVDDSTAADQRAVVNQKTMAAYVAAQAPAISAAGWDYTPSGAKRPTRGVAVIDLPLIQQGLITYLQSGDSYCQSAAGGDYVSVSTGSVWRIGPSGRVAFEIASTNKLLTVTAFSVVTNQARFTISTNGVTGGSVVVEYCADLATPLWLSVADLVTTNRTTNWTATGTATGTRGFYRAVSVGGDNRITSYYPHYFPAGVSGITAAQVGAVTLNSSYTNLMGLTARMYPSEASLVIDAMKQNEVLVTLTNDTIVSLPTNALVDGRTIKWRFYADGDRTVTWTAPDFKIPSSSTMSNVVTVSNGTYSIFVTEYAAPTTNWLVQAYIWGY